MKRMAIPALLVLACATGAAAEPRQVAGFSAVSVHDRVRVEIVTGQRYSVDVSGADAARIRTRLDGDTLQIRDANRPWFGEAPDLDVRIRISAPALERVSAARGADVNAAIEGDCTAISLAASMGGQARIVLPRCETVSASASMGGDLRIEGACRAFSGSASMGGIVRAGALRCETVSASASMGGEVNAHADEAYNASASMGGAINVDGDPSRREASSSFGGSIN